MQPSKKTAMTMSWQSFRILLADRMKGLYDVIRRTEE